MFHFAIRTVESEKYNFEKWEEGSVRRNKV